MKKIFEYIKNQFTGYYKILTTGVCGLDLYYDGCGCKQCNQQQKIEMENFKGKLDKTFPKKSV